MFEYQATVVRVVDGDTAHVKIDLGCDTFLQTTVRFFGINAPEKNTWEGKVSKAFLEDVLPVGQAIVLQTIKDKREKYGRYLGVLFKDGVNINNLLVEAGHAEVKVY